MEWKEAKIFVSSTFNDMHAERDYLVTEVFPELSEWCEERKIRLTDIDLRWGVTKEDSESGNTIRACLNCIDECRPFFLCFLGQRRGWVPDLNGALDRATLLEYQGLRQKLGRYSMTEMEIEHATLAPMIRVLQDRSYRPDKSHALFFFRNDPFHPDPATLRKAETDKKAEETSAAEDKKSSGGFFSRLFGRKNKAKQEAPAKVEEAEAVKQETEGAEEASDNAAETGFPSILTDDQKLIYTNAAADDEAGEDRRLAGSKEWISKDWTPYYYDCRWDPDLVTTELVPLGEVSRGRLTDFTVDGEQLKEIILNDLKKLIAEEFPENVPQESDDPFEADALEQQLLAQTSVFDFIGREEYLAQIREHIKRDVLTWAEGECQALFVTAPEGNGKTALLAKVCEEMRAEGHRVLFRTCGVTDKSFSVEDLYLSLGNEAGLFKAAEIEHAGGDKYIDDKFLRRLLESGCDTLILDGVDRLSDFDVLDKIEHIPGGFHVLFSGEHAEDWKIFKCFYKMLNLEGLQTKEERSKLVDQYLLRTLKKLDRKQKEMLISSRGAGSPLYLRVVLNELRSFGSFAELDDKIKRFGSTPASAYAELLRNLEIEAGGKELSNGKDNSAGDGSVRLLPALVGMLAWSRDGLDENEIMTGLDSMGIDLPNLRTRVRMLLRRLRPYIVRANGRFDIQNLCFTDAVTGRYASMEEKCRRALIAAYDSNLRAAAKLGPNEWKSYHGSREYLYQLEALQDWPGIRAALEDSEIFPLLDPTEYAGGYRNGLFFPVSYYENKARRFTPKHLCYSIEPGSEEGKEIYLMLGDVFLAKANGNIETINSKYSHPYATKCAKLRAKENLREFYEFRNLFYETTQYVRLAMRMTRLAFSGGSGRFGEARTGYEDFMKRANGAESFMDYLSKFGGDETGLSYQIEDLADGALKECNALREMMK